MLAHVPTLSRFYGIKVVVWWNDHPPPHVHVEAAGHRASLSIETLDLVDGRLSPRALRLLLEWALLHRDDLRRALDAAQRGEHPSTIEPLE